MNKTAAYLVPVKRDVVEIQALQDLRKTINSIIRNGNKKTISWNYQDHRVYPYYVEENIEKLLQHSFAIRTIQVPDVLLQISSSRTAEVLNESKTDFGLHGKYLYLKTTGENNAKIPLTITKTGCFILKRENNDTANETKYEIPAELLQAIVDFMIAGYPGYPTLIHILQRNMEVLK